jgi:CRP-like cAMP-binding protein
MEDISRIAEDLKESPLFKGVETEDRIALIRLMKHKTYLSGDVLFEKDSPGDALYIILSGRVAIYTARVQGQELSSSLTIRTYGERQLFGEFSMIDGKPRSASAAATERLEVLALYRDDFLMFLKERPVVGLGIMRNLVERVRYTTTFLQRVMDATEQLTQGNYEQAARQVSESGTNEQIRGLVEAFVKMMRNVKTREAALKNKQEADDLT